MGSQEDKRDSFGQTGGGMGTGRALEGRRLGCTVFERYCQVERSDRVATYGHLMVVYIDG
jgi:hypothetical protein